MLMAMLLLNVPPLTWLVSCGVLNLGRFGLIKNAGFRALSFKLVYQLPAPFHLYSVTFKAPLGVVVSHGVLNRSHPSRTN
jgi:hypothetical protein